MNPIFFSIIIPTYKDWDQLRFCLDALCKQSYPKTSFEVIVVNNNPASVCPYNLPANNIRIVNEEKPGSYAARNKGIKHAKGLVLAFTDSDCIPDNNWIFNAAKKFAENKTLARLAGKVDIYKTTKTPDSIYYYQRLFSMKQKSYVEKNGFGVTANLFVRKEVFDQVGLFREKLYSGGDDEWGKRATENGINISYCDQVVIFHPSRSSLQQLLKKKQRTTGGIYELRIKRLDKLQKSKEVLRRFIPPVNQIKVIKSKYSGITAIKIFFIAWAVKLASFCELVRLTVFKTEFKRQ